MPAKVRMKTKPGVTARLREIRRRADHVALTTRVLRSNLVEYAAFSQLMEKVMAAIRDYLCKSVSRSEDLVENIDSWSDRLKAVAEAQAALHETEETVEESQQQPDISEGVSALQIERARESKFRADLWTIRNQILRAELIDSGAVFRGLSGIFSTIVQMVKAGAGDPVTILNTVSSWKLPKCDDKTSIDLAKRLLQLCKPKEKILPSEWQEKYRIAPPGAVKEGKWKNWCYQKEPLDFFIQPDVSTMTLQWCSQLLGKTSTVQGILGYLIAEEPCACLVVHPTHDQAMSWSKNAFGPMLESTPILSRLMDTSVTKKGARSGYGEQTVLHKKFAGGFILSVGGNSPAPLRAHTVRVVILDEVDAYPESAGTEGDVATLAMQRNIKFPNAKTILTSTPTIKHFSRIEKSYFGSSDQRRWFITCSNCGYNRWNIVWNDVKWKKSRDNEGKTVHLIAEPDGCWLECPQCHFHFTDSERMALVEAGRWIATKPQVKGHRGYHLNGFVVLDQVKAGFRSWLHYFAQRFLDARALGTNGLRTFSTLICAEAYETEGSKTTDFEVLYQRKEQYAETADGEMILPEKCLVLVAAVDVQRSGRLECGIVGYGPGEEQWWICYGRFYGDIQKQGLWDEVYDFLARVWKHPSGHSFGPVCTCIDAAEQGDLVYAFCNKRQGRFFKLVPVRGEGGYETGADWIRLSNTRSQLRLLRTDSVKETIYRRLTIMQAGEEFIHFPLNKDAGAFDRSFFEQLTSEVMRTDRASPHFEKPYSECRNESLDIACMAEAARRIINPDYAAIQRWLATPPDPNRDWRTGGSAPVPKPPPPAPRPQQYTGNDGMQALKRKFPTPPSWMKDLGK
jgi:phage terminase large subunit GpA-like protein